MATKPAVRGQFMGAAGRTLTVDAAWAASPAVVKVGRDAEIETGKVLFALTKDGPSVINDLRIPIPGFSANIDHVVVHGNRVLIIDSKAWAGGFYWTLGQTTRRGLSAFAPADKKTLPTAKSAIENYLHRQGIGGVVVEQPLLAVWPTSPANFAFYRPAGGASFTTGSSLLSWLRRHTRHEGARPDLLVALAQLAN